MTFSPCDKAHTHEAVEFIQVDRSGELTGIFSGFHYGMGWWMSQGLPGVILDFGLFGSVGWLDIERNTGGYMAIDDYTYTLVDALVEPLAPVPSVNQIG